MEFDYCVENANETNFNNAKKAFEEKGYKLPNIIFGMLQVETVINL